MKNIKYISPILLCSIITLNSSPAYSGALASETTAYANLGENLVSAYENYMAAVQLIERVKQAKANLESFGSNMPDSNVIINELNDLANEITKAHALSYGAANYNEFNRQKWKDQQTVNDVSNNYNSWSTQNYNSIVNTLNGAGMQASLFADEHSRIETLRAKTNTAEGRNQMIQVGNHIAGDMVGQLQKLRQLMITDMRLKSNLAGSAQNEKDADRAAIEHYRNKPIVIKAPSTTNPTEALFNN